MVGIVSRLHSSCATCLASVRASVHFSAPRRSASRCTSLPVAPSVALTLGTMLAAVGLYRIARRSLRAVPLWQLRAPRASQRSVHSLFLLTLSVAALRPARGVSVCFRTSRPASLDSAPCLRSCFPSGAPPVTAFTWLPSRDLEGLIWVRPGAPGAVVGVSRCRWRLADLGIRARVEGCLGTRSASLVAGVVLSKARRSSSSTLAAEVGLSLSLSTSLSVCGASAPPSLLTFALLACCFRLPSSLLPSRHAVGRPFRILRLSVLPVKRSSPLTVVSLSLPRRRRCSSSPGARFRFHLQPCGQVLATSDTHMR